MIGPLYRIRIGLPGLLTRIYRSRAGLWFPELDAFADRRNNVLALLQTPSGLRVTPACNIVTDAGDIHIAQLYGGDAPTNAFTTFEMASAGTPGKAADRSNFTVIGSSQKVQTAGYPKANDDDVDNSGAGVDVRSTQTLYAAGDFNHAAITHGIVTNPSPGASEPILSGWAWADPIPKTADDTLKTILNHTMTGV